MQVRELMTSDVKCCTPDTTVRDAARMMRDCDCGAIPVADEDRRVTGMITDRDITCRAVAEGKDASQTKVGECMTRPPVTVTPESDADECVKLMEQHQVRRIAVVDDQGRCCGIVAQADVARHCSEAATSELVGEVSRSR